MGVADFGAAKEPKQKGGKKKPRKRRIAIRIDMTPMVDIAFLLLIFFMVTTVFRTPQALEINLPPKDKQVPIAQSNIFTLRVLPGPTLFWNVGEDEPERVDLDALPPILRRENDENAALQRDGKSKLVVLIKIDREAKFHNMVDIIDELDVAKVTRFSMAPLSEEDAKEVQALL